MIPRVLSILILITVIIYQYGFAVFLFSTTDASLLWSTLLGGGFCLLFLVSDKILLLSILPTKLRDHESIATLETFARFMKLSKVIVFEVPGSQVYSYCSIRGSWYICIGREKLKEISSKERAQLINICLLTCFKKYALIDQFVFLLIRFLLLPATLLKNIFMHNQISSFMYWLYYPLVYFITQLMDHRDVSGEYSAATKMNIKSREIEVIVNKFGFTIEDPTQEMLISKIFANQSSASVSDYNLKESISH